METPSTKISRRELLKRGAIVGGATLWATPVVQVVGMGKAYAEEVSPNCTRYCLKWEVDDNRDTGELTCPADTAHPVWSNNWEELGRRTGTGRGKVLACPGDGINDGDSADDIANRLGYEFVVYGSARDGFYVAFPNDIKLANLEDQPEPWSAAAKCGRGEAKYTKTDLLVEDDPCETDPNGDPYRRIFIDDCGNARDISHIELIIDWCPGDGPS